MISWLKKAGQTRTRVDNAAAMLQQRWAGLRLARRNLCAILLAVQLVLWLTLSGYDQWTASVWQGALLSLLPLGGLMLLWYFAAKKASHAGSRAWTGLLLIPCLWLDIFLCMDSCVSLMEYYIPTFPFYGRVLMVILFPLSALWLSKGSGVSYGLYPLRYILLFMFAFSTVLSGADVSPARLSSGEGLTLGHAAEGILSGAGAVWPVCLMFLLPAREWESRKSDRDGRWYLFILIPVVLMLIWALWMGMLRPWEPADALQPARKLTAISQYGGSMLTSQLGTLLWTAALPAAILGSLHAGQELLDCALPRCPRMIWPVLMLLPGAVLLLLPAATVTRWTETLLPLRWIPAAICGLALLLIPGKENAG